jgi:CheY-like chemotaxis protein
MTDSAPTILYIEDNVDNRILVRRILRAEGYDVLEAGDARETLQVVRNTRPDLILVDTNMPEVDGYTLTSNLKSDPNLATSPSSPSQPTSCGAIGTGRWRQAATDTSRSRSTSTTCTDRSPVFSIGKTGSVMKKPRLLIGTVLFSGQCALSSPC